VLEGRDWSGPEGKGQVRHGRQQGAGFRKDREARGELAERALPRRTLVVCVAALRDAVKLQNPQRCGLRSFVFTRLSVTGINSCARRAFHITLLDQARAAERHSAIMVGRLAVVLIRAIGQQIEEACSFCTHTDRPRPFHSFELSPLAIRVKAGHVRRTRIKRF